MDTKQPEALRLANMLEKPGYGWHSTPADELRNLRTETAALCADYDADRAARGAAQAAPVDAAVKPAINVGTIGHAGSGKTTLIAALGKLIAAQKGNHD